jgi:hypothetical protein
MQSFAVLQPGETTGCVGCHEQRTDTPHLKPNLVALKRSPSEVQPIADVPPVFDYPRDIQPILDRHCVACHRPERYEGRVDLTGDKTGMYTVSYWTMRLHELVSDGRNEPRGNRPPRTIGSSASRLMQLIDGTHYGAKLSAHEIKMVRLWIETSATYPGTYASLGCGYFPVHLAPLGRRCAECHAHPGAGGAARIDFNDEFRRERLSDLSRPEMSLLLRAPLARAAGGLELCGKPVFADRNDPLYQAILAAVQDARRRLEAGKRFDMAGFRPNEHYLREMQRFGVLPKDLKPTDRIDPYAVDRAYWDSFNYNASQE